jgi:RNA polymerase sigma factor (sigma-70 family)
VCYSNHTDASLLALWRGGDPVAGGALVRRHHPRIRRVFCISASNPDWVEDMVQQTFLIFCERRDHIEDPEKIRSYLLGIAHNLLRGYFRDKKKCGGNGHVDFDDMTVMEIHGTGFTTLFSNRQERLLLMRAMRRISVPDQLILQYKYWDDLTNREIAEIIEVPIGTLAGRIAAAKRRLGAELQRLRNLGHLLQSGSSQRAAS